MGTSDTYRAAKTPNGYWYIFNRTTGFRVGGTYATEEQAWYWFDIGGRP